MTALCPSESLYDVFRGSFNRICPSSSVDKDLQWLSKRETFDFDEETPDHESLLLDMDSKCYFLRWLQRANSNRITRFNACTVAVIEQLKADIGKMIDESSLGSICYKVQLYVDWVNQYAYLLLPAQASERMNDLPFPIVMDMLNASRQVLRTLLIKIAPWISCATDSSENLKLAIASFLPSFLVVERYWVLFVDTSHLQPRITGCSWHDDASKWTTPVSNLSMRNSKTAAVFKRNKRTKSFHPSLHKVALHVLSPEDRHLMEPVIIDSCVAQNDWKYLVFEGWKIVTFLDLEGNVRNCWIMSDAMKKMTQNLGNQVDRLDAAFGLVSLNLK